MRRRRKTKYTWLPGDNNPVSSGDESLNPVPFTIGGTITAGPTSVLPVVVVTNVLADFPETDVDTSAVSMADEIGSEYFIKRIVGKCHAAVSLKLADGISLINKDDAPTLLVCAGFFIAPADPSAIGNPLGTTEDIFQRYNPLSLQAIRQPWIWRRSWMLSPLGNLNGAGTVTVGGVATQAADEVKGSVAGAVLGLSPFPPCNALYGSVADGPHIDAKTARRVRLHERLWVSLAAMTMPEQTILDPTFINQVFFNATFDLRALGALRRARNRSNFA